MPSVVARGFETALVAAEETLARVDAVGPCEFPGSMMLREPCPECAHPVEQHRRPDKVCQACLLEGRRTEIDGSHPTKGDPHDNHPRA